MVQRINNFSTIRVEHVDIRVTVTGEPFLSQPNEVMF